MKALILKPEIIIPWHHENTYETLMQRALEEREMGRTLEDMLNDAWEYLTLTPAERMRRRQDREMKGWRYVQPAPVFDAPNDLLHLGQYVLCNGHNRREAAKRAGIMLPILLIECFQDIIWLVDSDEGVSKTMTLWEHKVYVSNCALEFQDKKEARAWEASTIPYNKQLELFQ